MIPAKVAAGILRACADTVEHQDGYKGVHDEPGALAIRGIPDELRRVADSVQNHVRMLLTLRQPQPPPVDPPAPTTEELRKRAEEVAAHLSADPGSDAKPLPSLTTKRLTKLVKKSLSVDGAINAAELRRKLHPLKAKYDCAYAVWLASLKPGDVICYENWHNPAEIISIKDGSRIYDMQIRNLGDGKETNAWASNIHPYDEQSVIDRANSCRVREIAKRLEEAATTGDTKTIEALEAVLK